MRRNFVIILLMFCSLFGCVNVEEDLEKDKLLLKIQEAEDLYNSLIEGDNVEEYKKGSKEELNNAILSSKDILEKNDLSQEMINNAYEVLEQAILSFKDKINTEVIVEEDIPEINENFDFFNGEKLDSSSFKSFRNDYIHDETFYVGKDFLDNYFVGKLNTITVEDSEKVSYKIIEGNSNNIFKIYSNGLIVIKNSANLKELIYNLKIEASYDTSTIVDIANIKINVIDSEKTFYIDSENGNDSFDGNTAQTAWKTIEKVNSLKFNPGDGIFFKRNNIWHEGLVVNDSGSEENPIFYGSYGIGDKAKFDFNSNDTLKKIVYGIQITEKSNVIIHDFEITAWTRYGIGITNSNSGESLSNNIEINRVEIHHLDPKDDYSNISHGLVMTNSPENVKILNSNFYNLKSEGIYASSKNLELAYCGFAYTDLINSGGDCIQLNNQAHNYHVHHNIIDHSNSKGGKGGVVCSHRTETAGDDYAGGLFEYNYIYGGPNDNFGFTTASLNDVIRYNYIKFDPERPATAKSLEELGVETVDALPDFGVKGGVTAYYNIIDGYSSSISASKSGANYFYYNNLFLNNYSKYLIFVQGGRTPNIEFFNNIVIGSPSMIYNSRISEDILSASNNLYSVSGNINELGGINEDPKFKNSLNGDYSLLIDSPAINSGIKLDIHNLDFSEKVLDDLVDIGPFEF